MRKSVKILGGVLLVATIAGSSLGVSANNWQDSRFDFNYICDGCEEITRARSKKDDTCSYVKCDSRSEAFDAFIRGARDEITLYPGEEEWGMVNVKPGQYKYIRNNAYGRYPKVRLCVGLSLHAHDGSKHRLGGWWSPDNRKGIK